MKVMVVHGTCFWVVSRKGLENEAPTVACGSPGSAWFGLSDPIWFLAASHASFL